MSRQLVGALIASIDALCVARDYAKSKGIDVNLVLDFNAEDARTLASTALIQAQKEQERVARTQAYSTSKVNGVAH